MKNNEFTKEKQEASIMHYFPWTIKNNNWTWEVLSCIQMGTDGQTK